ncbi:ATP-dependent DNA helicase [Solibacillus silvestris]
MRITTKSNIHNFVLKEIFQNKLVSSGYSIRDPQIELVEHILDFLENGNKIFACEAEVGTGKSFAYLFPLITKQNIIKQFRNSNIILSTATIALQEQLLSDVKKVLEILNLSTTVTLSKGQNNFVCLARLNHFFKDNTAPLWTMSIEKISKYGDKVDLFKHDSQIKDYWNKINIQSCRYTNCSYFNNCPYIKLKDQLKSPNQIIITNHDQLIYNAKKVTADEKPILSEYVDYVVIDEAHNLEDKAFSALTLSFSPNTLLRNIDSIDKIISRTPSYKKILADTDRINESLLKLESILNLNYENEIKNDLQNGFKKTRFKVPSFNINFMGELILLLEKHVEKFEIVSELMRVPDSYVQAAISIENDIKFFKEYIKGDKIFWMEKEKKEVKIYSVPEDISEILSKEFFGWGRPKFLLTSGTISQLSEPILEDKYEKFLTDIGIRFDSNTVVHEPKTSPFDFNKNTRLYIPEHLPSPNNIEKYREAALTEMLKVLRISDGRALILFTSKDDMNFIYQQLSKLQLPWKILLQHSDGVQQKVIEEFKNEEKSILLSTGVFWEGIDIKGKTLSNLIIFRLPFPVPDPVLDHKREQSFSKEEFLETYLIPKMITKLRQGIGRLIRSESDKGFVTILDPRIARTSNKFYKNTVLNSFKLGPQVQSLNELEAFSEEINL